MRKEATLLLVLALSIFTCQSDQGSLNSRQNEPLKVKAALVKAPAIGQVIDHLNDIPIYYNGGVRNTSGRHKSTDGYNYGLKWQCVEFVKRYYFDHLNHRMPNTWGHAREFFNLFLYDGDLNPDRGLYQFRNGSLHKPRPDDIIVFSADRFGHVAIVSEVGPDYIEIAQQNVRDESRDRFELMNDNGRWRIRDARILGWLSRFKTTLKSH